MGCRGIHIRTRGSSSLLWMMRLVGRSLMLGYLLLLGSSAATTELGSIKNLEVIQGAEVLLPCNVTPLFVDDKTVDDEVMMVLIFHRFSGAPIYSIDGRGHRQEPVIRNSSLRLDSDRGAYFIMNSAHPGLVLPHVLRYRDRGHYRCRVDFRDAPSRDTTAHLQIIILPSKVTILENNKLEVTDLVGPYALGSSVAFTCNVASGQPASKVTWWLRSKLIDDASVLSKDAITKNTLILPPLSRSDLYKEFTCMASNTNLSAPIETRITIDISFPPEEVKILDIRTPQVEGKTYSIICESSGSRPSVNISWYKDGRIMADSKIFREGIRTRSTVQMTPIAADNDGRLTCRAKNDLVPSYIMEDSVTLNVLYVPHVHLSLGENLNVADIQEGDDVYFECSVTSNPNHYKVQWFKNYQKIFHNISKGIIMSNMSLVLQKVTHNTRGNYSCSAYNSQGQGTSDTLYLNVKFMPVCQSKQKVMYTFGKKKSINFTCSVISYPKPIDFRWDFKTTSGVAENPKENYWKVSTNNSLVYFNPEQLLDSGTLLCWARNIVGLQVTPCVYQIIQEASPESVNDCKVVNLTSNKAIIRCQPGWDGGLAQRFTMSVSHQNRQLYAEEPKLLAYTSISPRPEFVLSQLESDVEYIVTIIAVNQRGSSKAVELVIKTPRHFTQSTVTSSHEDTVNPVLAVLSSIIAIILLVMFIAAIVIRNGLALKTQDKNNVIDDKRTEETKNMVKEGLKRNIYEPDIIPLTSGEFYKDTYQTDHVKKNKNPPETKQNASCMIRHHLYDQIDNTRKSEHYQQSNATSHANKTVTFGELEEVNEIDSECILESQEKESCLSASSPEMYKYPQHSTPKNERIPAIPRHFSTLVSPKKNPYLLENISVPRNGYLVSNHGQFSHISASYFQRSMFHEGRFNSDLVLYHERISTRLPTITNSKRYSLSRLESPV